MKRFASLDDLRRTPHYPRSAAALRLAKTRLLGDFEERVQALHRPPSAVVDSARALGRFLADSGRIKSQDHEALAAAALEYLFGDEDEAIKDTIEFVGYTDDSIIMDAVLQEIAAPTAKRKPVRASRKPVRAAGKPVRAIAKPRSKPVSRTGSASSPRRRK